jgi:hypothetical protein
MQFGRKTGGKFRAAICWKSQTRSFDPRIVRDRHHNVKIGANGCELKSERIHLPSRDREGLSATARALPDGRGSESVPNNFALGTEAGAPQRVAAKKRMFKRRLARFGEGFDF